MSYYWTFEVMNMLLWKDWEFPKPCLVNMDATIPLVSEEDIGKDYLMD